MFFDIINVHLLFPVTEASTLVKLLKNSSSGPSDFPMKEEQRADKANIQTGN